uniref:C2H2-type domain-containing protein n=1 Tax=Panagrellus redivivus TaxID=6233 RepID=A0A7E4W2X6_PANRE
MSAKHSPRTPSEVDPEPPSEKNPKESILIPPVPLFGILQCQICGIPVMDVIALQSHTITMHSMLKFSKVPYVINVMPLPEPEVITIDDDTVNSDNHEPSSSPEPSLLRLRERPVQQKHELALIRIRKRLDELRSVDASRELTEKEVRELENLLSEEFYIKRKLKKAIDAATRAKRYRIKRSLTNDSLTSNVNFNKLTSENASLAIEDFRPPSASCFSDMASAAQMFAVSA